jgi:hypothetical protein
MISELARAETPDYKVMLMQGLCMCLWYNTGATIMALEQTGHTQNVFSMLEHLLQTSVKQDFEIKRIVLGLTQLVNYSAGSAGSLPASVSNALPMLMKALVHLSQKSIVVRQKNHEKEEQAEVDNGAEAAGEIIEDEEDGIDLISDDEDDENDEDYDCNEDMDGHDLYDSKLDSMDEVLFFRDMLVNL